MRKIAYSEMWHRITGCSPTFRDDTMVSSSRYEMSSV